MFSRTWTLIKMEFYKLFKQKIFYISFAVVIIVVLLSVYLERSSKPAVNGFKPLMSGCINGFRLSAFLILIISSLLYASETTLGTIKTILVAPFRRTELILAKTLTVVILAVLFVLVVEAISYLSVLALYKFSNITDPTFPEIIHLPKSEMFLYILYSFVHIVLPMIAIGLLGLFVSTLVENSGIAVAISIIVYLILDTFVEGMYENISTFLFNHYLNYYLGTCRDITEGVLDEIWKFEVINRFFVSQKQNIQLDSVRIFEVVKSITIPIGSSIIFLTLSIISVNKKRNG